MHSGQLRGRETYARSVRLLAIVLGISALLPCAQEASASQVKKCTIRHHAKCTEANLSKRNLHGVVLHHADLRGANLDYADLSGANLEYADLRGASLRHANLRGARLRRSKLHHRTLQQGIRSQGTPDCSPDCQGGDLSYADLTNAQLAGANLSFANLTSADLSNAELRSANFLFADFDGATLNGADFTGATNCESVEPAGILTGEGCADDNAPVCYSYSPYSAAIGTFTVTGNAFTQVATFTIPDNDTQITSMYVQASVSSSGIVITSPYRYFVVGFSGSTSGTFAQSFSGNQVPWSSNSGTTVRSLPWDVIDTGYGVAGSGRIRVNGGGAIGTWATNPDQRIRVTIQVTGTTRTAGPCT